MLRAQVCAVLGFGLMLAAASTEARELDFLVDNTIGWDTNVFNRSANSKSDGYWEFSPRLSLRDRRDTLEYDFSYRPTYQAYGSTNNIDGFDHYGKVDFDWRLTPADTLSFKGSIASTRIVRQFSDPTRFIVVESDGDRAVRSRASLAYNRSFGPVLSGRLDLYFEDLDFDDDSNVDSRSYSATVSSTRVVDARTQVGLSGRGSYREGRGLDYLDPPPAPIVLGQFSSKTVIGDISLSFLRAITPTIQFSARAGPSFTRTESNAPPGRDADRDTFPLDRTDSGNDVSYVADVSLSRTGRNSTASIGYTRFQSGTGGTSSTSIVDQVSFKVNHRPTRQLKLDLNLTWDQRRTLTSVGAVDRETFKRYSIFATAAYSLTRQLSIIGRGSFRHLSDQSSVVNVLGQNTTTQVTETFVGTITLRYSFDPVIF